MVEKRAVLERVGPTVENAETHPAESANNAIESFIIE